MGQEEDRPAGVLSRRRALFWLGSAGAWVVAGPERARAAGASLPQCIARPEQTEGPYFVDEQLHRSDIRSDPADGSLKPGTPLALRFLVSRLRGAECVPLAGAVVDVWHCDAEGVYSGVRDWQFQTVGRKFLRGYQVTGADGSARFLTIYPGGYRGRTVHIHFKVRTDAARGRDYEFTSQLYFDDGTTQVAHAAAPYAARRARLTPNAADGIFRRGGAQLMLDAAATASGYTASFPIALDLP